MSCDMTMGAIDKQSMCTRFNCWNSISMLFRCWTSISMIFCWTSLWTLFCWTSMCMLCLCTCILGSMEAAVKESPNLLFIIVDDLNHLPMNPKGRPHNVAPNMQALAREGLMFNNAHCNVALCESSRTSLLYGQYPQTTGVYWFESWKQRKSMQKSVAMTSHLKNNGYAVYGTGKVYHKNDHREDFERYGVPTNYGPHPVNGIVKYMGHHSSMDEALEKFSYPSSTWNFLKWEQTFGPLEDIPNWSHLPEGKKGWTLYGKPWHLREGHNRDPLPDEDCVQFSRTVLREKHQQPFALFCGLVRTHTPLYAPQAYFDRFPLESLTLPEIQDGDTQDCAKILSHADHYGFLRYQFLKLNRDADLYRRWLQAYLACVAFVDDQIGELMSELKASPHADNTLVILTSDHGFHMGEKGFLYKHSLWEEATRVPLIIKAPKSFDTIKGQSCEHPVSLVDLYPTVVDLLNLPPVPNPQHRPLDGHSLSAFLKRPTTSTWTGPKVAITALSGMDHMMDGKAEGAPYPHFAVRSKNYRYILCSNGEEELYHHDKDPLEHRNLAHSPEFQTTKAQLKQQLIALREGHGWQEQTSDLKQREIHELSTHQALEFDLIATPSHDGQVLQLVDSNKVWLSERGSKDLPQHWRARFDGQRVEVWVDGICKLSLNRADPIRGKLKLKASDSGFMLKQLRTRAL